MINIKTDSRKVKKGDSRYKILEITDKGREIISLAEANKDEVEKKIIQGISNEELTLFKKIINKMSNNLGGNYEEEWRKSILYVDF